MLDFVVLGDRLDEALARAEEYFLGRGSVKDAAVTIARILEDSGIDYAIAGALACAAYGHERMTVDVDVLITREGLRRFKEAWLGRGYEDAGPGLKAVRDTKRNVKIDFLIAGDFPGDGKPKPVAFPDPDTAAEETSPLRVLRLKHLLELKVASGMTAPHRLRDLDDAMRLVAANDLGPEYADELDPFVREKFLELQAFAQIQEDY